MNWLQLRLTLYSPVVTICTAQWSLYVPHSVHYMYRKVVTMCTTSLTLTNSTFCPHSVFMCFVWIWEQTAIISLYSIDWLVFITETECVYCAVRSTFCPQSVFMCFVWIWEQTAIISLYSINWLVFITETECVYCAVRSAFYVLPTQCIYVFCVDLRTNSDYFPTQCELMEIRREETGKNIERYYIYIITGANRKNIFLWKFPSVPARPSRSYVEHKALGNEEGIALQNNRLAFLSRMQCVYYAVWNERLKYSSFKSIDKYYSTDANNTKYDSRYFKRIAE